MAFTVRTTHREDRKSGAKRSRNRRSLQKPNGVISSRVQKVGGEKFGIVCIDPAKHRSEWMMADLAATDKKVIVFAHQRLDVNNNHGVKNNADVRKILETSNKVLAAFQGHSHKNDLKEIGGIHYCTLVAMVVQCPHSLYQSL